MHINFAAFQAALSQPWVLALGVWVIAVAFATGILIEFARAVTAAVRGIALAHRNAQARRRMRGLRLTVADVDGQLVKRLVPIGSVDRDG